MTAKVIGHFINGKNSYAGDKVLDIFNPASGQKRSSLAVATDKEIHEAVSVAEKAFPAWSLTPISRRQKIFFEFVKLLGEHVEELATLVTLEHGKLLEDARASVMRGIEVAEYCCQIQTRLVGTKTRQYSTNVDVFNTREPLGICVGIAPFNFPVMIPLWLALPAIACGNTFILKPSERVPSSAMLLAELLQRAGLPDGVFNIIHGDGIIAKSLLKHPKVKAVTAIGSTPVAKSVYEDAVSLGKRAHTFGGAKNHCVVLSDMNLEHAANDIVSAAFGGAGQRCMAISVVVTVGEDTSEKLSDLLVQKIGKMKVGVSDKADMGPLNSLAAVSRVKKYVDQGIAQGAKLLVDGRKHMVSGHEKGYYLGPCLFGGVTDNMSIYKDEIFGPVLCMVSVDDIKDAIHMINKNPFGNAAVLYTYSGQYARYFSQSVNTGMVGINVPLPVPPAAFPFGGSKSSFFGDVSLHGDQTVPFYTKNKTILERWFFS